VTNVQQSSQDNRIGAGEEAAPVIARFCQDMMTRLKMDLSAEAEQVEGTVTVNLIGADRPLLLSNTAALLNSIEYLVNKVFRTGKEARISSIILDSDSYRQHRQAELTLLAEMAAKKVIAQRNSLRLQPMTPRERRIVHLALAEIEGVRSESEGEGEHRSITIHPS
jgi:spoIIIJ-associated protein